MGMFYCRIKRRFPVGFTTTGPQYIAAYKTTTHAEDTDRRLKLGFSYEGAGFGWCFSVQSSNSSSAYPGGRCWQDEYTANTILPRRPDSYYWNDPNSGETCFYKGPIVDFTGSGEAPEPDWTLWQTIEFAFRLHNTNGEVAGNLSQGWIWVATSQGTATSYAPNGTGQMRMFISGPNIWDKPFIGSSFTPPRCGTFYLNNPYGSGYPTNFDYDLGSLEVYDYWPDDASSHPAGAI